MSPDPLPVKTVVEIVSKSKCTMYVVRGSRKWWRQLGWVQGLQLAEFSHVENMLEKVQVLR
jgi:hypothetical protein